MICDFRVRTAWRRAGSDTDYSFIFYVWRETDCGVSLSIASDNQPYYAVIVLPYVSF